MEKNLLIALFAVITMTGCEKVNKYTLSGDFTEYEKQFHVSAKVDSVYILNDSTAVVPAG